MTAVDQDAAATREAELGYLRAMHEIRFFEDECHRIFAAGSRARQHPPLPGPGGGVGRRRRRAAGRRHDDLHVPRPRRGPRDGRAARQRLRRDPRQGRRALRRQGRLDAPHRRERGAFGSFAIVGAHLPIAAGLALRRAVSRHGRGERSASSATARRTSAPSTRRSTSPRSGSCRCSSCARTTSTASTRRWRRPHRSSRLADRADSYAMAKARRRRQRRARRPRRRRRGGRARTQRRRPDADRGTDLSPEGALALRPGDLPPAGRARRVARARSDHAAPRRRCVPRAFPTRSSRICARAAERRVAEALDAREGDARAGSGPLEDLSRRTVAAGAPHDRRDVQGGDHPRHRRRAGCR